jgi:hypothetical protein
MRLGALDDACATQREDSLADTAPHWSIGDLSSSNDKSFVDEACGPVDISNLSGRALKLGAAFAVHCSYSGRAG